MCSKSVEIMSLFDASESEYYHSHANNLYKRTWAGQGREGHKIISCCLVKQDFHWQAIMPVSPHPSDYSEHLSFELPFIPSA